MSNTTDLALEVNTLEIALGEAEEEIVRLQKIIEELADGIHVMIQDSHRLLEKVS